MRRITLAGSTPAISDRAERWVQRIAGIAALVALALGALDLIGWATDRPVLASWIPAWPRMVPGTGISVVLVGCAILAARTPSGTTAARLLGGGTIVAVVATVLMQRGDASSLWSMAPAPATALGLLGLGALIVGVPRLSGVRQALALAAGWIGWLALGRYFYGGQPLSPLVATALPTALALVALSLGVLLARADGGLVALLCARGAGGSMARWLLPCATVIPIGIGWLWLLGERIGTYSAATGQGLFAMSLVVALCAVVWIYAQRLQRADAARRHHQAAAEHLAELVRSCDDAIVGFDRGGRIISWNGGAERLFGRSEADALGHRYDEVARIEGGIATAQLRAKQLSDPGALPMESELVLDDGRRIAIATTVSPILDPEGAVVGYSEVSRDISRAKRDEQVLRAQLASLDLLSNITKAIAHRRDEVSINHVVVATLVRDMGIDCAAVCQYEAGGAALAVAAVYGGGDAADAAGVVAGRSLPLGDLDLSACGNGELVYHPRLSRLETDAGRRLIAAGFRSMVAVPLQVEARVEGAIVALRREPESFVGTERDFLAQLSHHVALARRHAELHAALRDAYDELKRNQDEIMRGDRLRVLGQLVSGIAHDLNNALAPVQVYVDLIEFEEGLLSERSRKGLDVIRTATSDAAATVARLREFYRQRDERAELVAAELNPMVEEVAALTRPRWAEGANRVELELDLAADIPPVLGVASEIRQALTNLVINGLDAMPEGGTLTVRTRLEGHDDDEAVVLEVGDVGTGMSPLEVDRCFEPFFTTKGGHGTGLGLAMVHGIVQRHRGTIEVDSREGVGTTFRIRFTELALEARPSGSMRILRGIPRRLRLLLVDDDPLVLSAVHDGLVLDGHEVAIAERGEEALATLAEMIERDATPDAVITDLAMPGMDGRQLTAAIKGMYPDLPVLILTGWGPEGIDDGSIVGAADRVLGKPIPIRDLVRAVGEVIEPPASPVDGDRRSADDATA